MKSFNMNSKVIFYKIAAAYVLFSCTPYFAAMAQAQIVSGANYLPLTEPQNLSAFKQLEIAPLLAATFHANFANGNCTGTYISNEGHFITADHCIKGCFDFGKEFEDNMDVQIFKKNPDMLTRFYTFKDKDGKKYLESKTFSDEDMPHQSFTFQRYLPEMTSGKVLCDVEVNGERKRARLVVFGNGNLNPYKIKNFESAKIETLYRNFEKSGVGWPTSDFAILQMIDKPKTECMQLGVRPPEDNEKLKAISYTCIATSSRPSNYSGEVALYTEGILATADMFKSADEKNSYTPKNYGNMLHSNIDADTCSSGSSVVGSDGTILGVMSMVRDKNETWGPHIKLVELTSAVGISRTVRQQLGHDIICKP